MLLSSDVGRGPRDIVLDGDLAPPYGKVRDTEVGKISAYWSVLSEPTGERQCVHRL